MAPKPTESLRRTLLDASLELIAAEGLEGFSMREVARRAGVSHQAPYHHFPDREAILAAIVAEGFERLRDTSRAALEGVADPFSRLTTLGKAYVAFAHDNPAHFKLMFRSELVREDRHDNARECAESAFNVLVSVAGEVSAARGKQEESDTLVLTAWSLVHGLSTLMLEGKLDKAIAGEGAHLEAANAALEMFEALMRQRV